MRLGYESDIESLLVREVGKLGGRCVKWGINGEPDRMVMLPGGKVVFVETKREDGKLSPLQEEKIKRLRELGFEVLVPYSKCEARKIIAKMKKFMEEEKKSSYNDRR